MIRILLSTSSSAKQCQPQLGLGRAAALFAYERVCRFNGDKSVSESIHHTVAEWLNLDQLTSGSLGMSIAIFGWVCQDREDPYD